MVEKEGNHWWEKNPEKFQFPNVPFWYSLWYCLPWCRALSWQRTCTNYLPGCLPFIPTTCWGGGLKGAGGDFRLTSALSAPFRALLPFVMSCQFVQTRVLSSSTCVSAFSSNFFQSWTFLRELFRFDLSSCNVIKRETCKFHNPIIILDHPVSCRELIFGFQLCCSRWVIFSVPGQTSRCKASWLPFYAVYMIAGYKLCIEPQK